MQDYCHTCRARFFISEDEYYEGWPICSYCFPYVQLCEICRKPHKAKRKVKNEFTICEACAAGLYFPNVKLIRRFMVLKNDGFMCRYCGRSPINDPSVELQVDHIYPKAKGGKDESTNYVTACSECNRGKSDILLAEYQAGVVRNRAIFESNFSKENKVEVGQGNECNLAHNLLLAEGDVSSVN